MNRRQAWCFAILVAMGVTSLILLGAMSRGDVSPWVWVEYREQLRQYGSFHAAGVALAYIALYLSAFLFPYIVAVSWAMRRVSPESDTRGLVWVSAGFVALGSGCLFIFCLRGVAQFFASLPWNIWNGWLGLLCVVISGGSLLIGAAGLCELKAKSRRGSDPHFPAENQRPPFAG